MSNPQTHIPPATPSGSDPLAALHKMSRTAGLGTTEYVEVNPAAVATLLLGLASASAVLAPLLLIIPAVAVIIAFIAIRQINRSAGTQTGKGIALLGLALALVFVAVVGGRELLHARDVAAEKDEILKQIDALGKNLNQANYDAAWQQFSERFHERGKKEDFVNLWTMVQNHPMLGQIKSMRSNGIVDVQFDKETGQTYARGIVILEYANRPEDRRQTVFRKEDRGWVFEDIEGFFPAQPKGPQ